MSDVEQPPHAVLALWLPAVVAAHLYVALFLFQLLRIARPQLWKRFWPWQFVKQKAGSVGVPADPERSGESRTCLRASLSATSDCFPLYCRGCLEQQQQHSSKDHPVCAAGQGTNPCVSVLGQHLLLLHHPRGEEDRPAGGSGWDSPSS
jgi:hypothetical protein